MPWSPSLTRLRDALVDLYPDGSDARRVALDAGLPTSRIALQGAPVNVWHAILEEAEKQGRVEDIIRLALGEYPRDEGLRAAARALGVGAGGPGGAVSRSTLLNVLTQRLSASDLRALSFNLGVDYEDLPGEAKPDKARELILYLERRGRLPELAPALRELRPDIDQDSPHGRTVNEESSFVVPPSGGSAGASKTVILFLASDPSDATRLRLGEEARAIHERLRLAAERDRFDLQSRWSVRAVDLTQALLDVQPRVVHFAGHGEGKIEARGRGGAGQEERGLTLVSAAGAPVAPGADTEDRPAQGGGLYLEDDLGQAQLVPAAALAALFEQFADHVQCVVLNACYSEGQARAIAQHIPYVVGMHKAIGDRAAIAFATGFYMALGAGRKVEQAYKLGCVQIGLQGIPEHLTPVLIEKGRE